MRAMTPFFNYIFNLEGFEMVAFWLGLLISVAIVGFTLDYLMQRQGFGPLLNGLLALFGAFLGLYLRYNYFVRDPWFHFEPYVTMALCFGTPAILLVVLSFLRNRYG